MSIRVERYRIDFKNNWDNFVLNAKNINFMHFRNYMDYHSVRFKDHSLIMSKENKLIAILPACEIDNKIFSHAGLTFGGLIQSKKAKANDIVDAFKAICEYAAANKINSIIYKAMPHIFQQHPSEEDLYAIFKMGALIYSFELTTVIDLKSKVKFSNGKKYGVKRALKESVRIEECDEIDLFFKIVKENLFNKYGISPVHTSKEMRLLKSRFPKNIRLFGAFQKEELVAGALVYLSDTVCHTQYIASNEKGKLLRAVDLLISELIKRWSNKKLYLNFGISTENGGKVLNKKLIKFKEEYGGTGVVHQTFEIPIIKKAGI